MRNLLIRPAAVAGAVSAITLATALTAVAAPTTVLDETLVGPFAGAELCLVEACIPLKGIKNLRITASYEGAVESLPAFEKKAHPSCTANVQTHYKMTTSRSGQPGSVALQVTYDRSDKNGNTIPGSGSSVQRTLPVGGTVVRTFDPLVSFCSQTPAVPPAPAVPSVPSVPERPSVPDRPDAPNRPDLPNRPDRPRL